jgi:release factor glutamine methyltransferase
VLIPRPETEELVQWILDDVGIDVASAKLRILDIGTGSGCIAVSLAKFLPKAKITALDFSEKALKIARENAALNEVEVNFLLADILQQEKLEENIRYHCFQPALCKGTGKKGDAAKCAGARAGHCFVCKR